MASDRYSSLVKMDGAPTICGWTMETVVIVDASVGGTTGSAAGVSAGVDTSASELTGF